MRTWLRYFLIAVRAWVVVDFTTTPAVGNPRAYYSKYLPALLLFYIGYPLIFSALIYRFGLRAGGLFLAMLAGIVVVENWNRATSPIPRAWWDDRCFDFAFLRKAASN